MNFQIEVRDQKVNVWTQEARVEAVMLRASTEVWTEGGGGYVSAHGGGWVNAPQVRSQTTEFKEVRIVASDGSRCTVNVKGNVTLMPGDDVCFVYASPEFAQSGKLAGVINHTEGQFWKYSIKGLIEYRLHGMIATMLASPFIAFLLLFVGMGFFALFAGLAIFIAACVTYKQSKAELDENISTKIMSHLNTLKSARVNKTVPAMSGATVVA
jgi:hypothetical protein